MIKSFRNTKRLLALFLLLVIAGLLVGRTLHIYSHIGHSYEVHHAGGDSGQSSTEECSLCNYVVTAVENPAAEIVVLIILVVTIITLYLQGEPNIYVALSNSRAPPAVIS